jgi:hypothetical protein
VPVARALGPGASGFYSLDDFATRCGRVGLEVGAGH